LEAIFGVWLTEVWITEVPL